MEVLTGPNCALAEGMGAIRNTARRPDATGVGVFYSISKPESYAVDRPKIRFLLFNCFNSGARPIGPIGMLGLHLPFSNVTNLSSALECLKRSWLLGVIVAIHLHFAPEFGVRWK